MTLTEKKALAKISIHALFAEGDFIQLAQTKDYIKFLSTPSSQRATHPRSAAKHATDISIHALFAEGDHILADLEAVWQLISIHALFAEGDTCTRSCIILLSLFLSTPSSQRATRDN